MRRYAHNKDTFGEVKDFPALSVALESKVIADRETLFSRLKELTAELVRSETVYTHMYIYLTDW